LDFVTDKNIRQQSYISSIVGTNSKNRKDASEVQLFYRLQGNVFSK